MIFLDH